MSSKYAFGELKEPEGTDHSFSSQDIQLIIKKLFT